MKAALVGTWPVGSPEWHAARRSGLGGSEIAAVMGLSPYESRFSLWHRKSGALGDVAQNDEMYWGTALEPVIAAEFCLRHPDLTLMPSGLWRNHRRSYQLATPDGIFSADELLEVKTARYDDGWGTPGSDEIPVHYRAQVQWYLDCLGAQRCHVAVLITGSDYREYLVEYDQADAVTMRAAAEEFMATLLVGQRPDIDAHSATYAAVRELHPDIEPHSVELPAPVALAYLDALAAAKDADAAKREASARVIDAMGNAHKATHLGAVIATRAVRGECAPHLRAAKGAADQHRSTAA